MHERIEWATENEIKCHVSFRSLQDDINVPTCYRLYTGFVGQDDADRYKDRWSWVNR